MTEYIFWDILSKLNWRKEGNDNKVLAPAVKYLSKLSDEDIFEFENIMSKLLYDIDCKDLAIELYRSADQFSYDLFLYQRCTAIINGRKYYYEILNRNNKLNPDLEFESILYLPMKAWAKKHHKKTNEYPHIAEPSYESCSNIESWGE